MEKIELEKLYEKFIGEGKVHSLSLIAVTPGGWKWSYKEGRIQASIIDEDRAFLEKMHMEFGGNNPETCRASDVFLELRGFDSEDVLNVGHRITKIGLKGSRTTRHQTIPIDIPPRMGSNEPIRAKKKLPKDSLNLILKDLETAAITRAFSTQAEFDAFREFLLTHSALKELTWYVDILGTESKLTRDFCVWHREKVGDGTQRMALELIGLNGKVFTECRRGDLFDAADEMFDSACQRVKLKKEKEIAYKTVCFFAAEDGQVDLGGYEAAP